MLPPPPPPPKGGFVSVVAKISMLLTGLSIVWMLFQVLVAALLPDSFAYMLSSNWPIPRALLWALEHRVALSLLLLMLSILSFAASWGLLKRQEWARVTFIVLLLVSAAGNLVSLLLVTQMFDAILAMYPRELLDTPDGQEFLAQMKASQAFTMFSSVAAVLAMAALHAWIAWKLCTAAVHAEFKRPQA